MEQSDFNHPPRLEARFHLWQPEKALVDHDDVVQPPSPSPPVLIHIDFVSKTFHQWLIHDGRRARLIREVEFPTVVVSECVDARAFTSEYVAGKLPRLEVDPRIREPIAEEVIAWGRRVGNLASENVGPKIVPLRIEITMVHISIRETESIESAIRRQSWTEFESRNNGSYGMVPASEWSVRELKRKRAEEREGEICSVCLEELPSGLEVTAMPCSHLFHHYCINTWLKTSHLCPVCRFEMPIA